MDIESLYSKFQEHPFISTDTRKIIPGSIFFALNGDHFDGNTFALQALQLGAAYAVVTDRSLSDSRLIYVDDTLDTLQTLATYHRSQLRIPVIGITGSNGKTTTKELITTVLSKKYKVHATVGNLNNHIGVPLTVLSAKPDTEILVCEMGANHLGEIASLCTIAAPTHGIITNIGKAHLEGFGSIEGVRKAKGELFDYLQQHQGFAFVNADDRNLRELGESMSNKITYGLIADAQVQFRYEAQAGTQGFTIEDTRSDFKITSSMFGHYNATNMLAVYVVANHFSVDLNDIQESLGAFVPGANRSEIVTKYECLVVKDAYNANPSSMALAIEAFAAQYPLGWIVLGDMKELGETSHTSHLQIIRQVASQKFSRIYLIGNAFSAAFKSAQLNDSRFTNVENIETMKSTWSWNDCKDQAILLKGSRSMHLELLLEH